MNGLDLTGRTIENTRSTASFLSATAKIKSRCQACCSIRRREQRAKMGGSGNLRLEGTCAQETKKSRTEGNCEGGLGDRGKRQRWKRWHECGGRKKQKPKSSCVASTALTGRCTNSCCETSKTPEPCSGVVFDIYIVSSQPGAVMVAKAQTQAHMQQKVRGHGLAPPFIWAWAGLIQGLITEGTKL